MVEKNVARVIKRYPNRRRYDVDASRYVNLNDLRLLVIDGIKFQVVVEKTQEDQTKSVLMQIFLELEMGGQPLFSDQSLKNLIVLNSTLSNDMAKSYLSSSFAAFYQNMK
jgi:polyhydroxyalkanoate synthesis repressor PhaR